MFIGSDSQFWNNSILFLQSIQYDHPPTWILIITPLIIILAIPVAFYLFTSRNKKDIVDHKQEMILLFGISFSTTFLLKTCVESILTNTKVAPSVSEPSILNSSRPPF